MRFLSYSCVMIFTSLWGLLALRLGASNDSSQPGPKWPTPAFLSFSLKFVPSLSWQILVVPTSAVTYI